jgi:hypothetical protein
MTVPRGHQKCSETYTCVVTSQYYIYTHTHKYNMMDASKGIDDTQYQDKLCTWETLLALVYKLSKRLFR